MMAFYTATSLLLVMLVIANWSILLDAKVNRTWERTQFLKRLSKRAGPDAEPVIVPRIVGGVDAKIKAWPWMVVIEIGNKYCGGVLITDSLVLTAAHCVKGKNFNNIILRLGVLNLNIRNVNEQRFRAKDVIVHNGFSWRTAENDIALIQLNRPARLNDYVSTISLPAQNYVVPLDASCFATGWGWTGKAGYGILQKVKLPIVNQQICTKKYAPENIFQITQNMLCAGYWKQQLGTCNGDSGGPLACQDQHRDGRYVVQGLTSWGIINKDVNGNPICTGYSVSTRVSKYRDWIDQNTI